VRRTRVWARLLGVKGVIVEEVPTEEDEDGELAAIVVAVRVPRRETGRCGVWVGAAPCTTRAIQKRMRATASW
jgi:hypothetical protein